ncbi:hypothetical protein Mal4_45290 [Maioricimonas rarisocia]|uniref:Cytochrome c domain-containing protein n=1 Tax=Maioricimonas rarisocia TaxID=2528026 RepID=A0A517ZCE4_9PLAN|nr:DUF1800 family protein [Maioricimonas rarisocia]QDU40174.1 hypothetical protein Mal4_45290 [Maioricimonas rarisocia]
MLRTCLPGILLVATLAVVGAVEGNTPPADPLAAVIDTAISARLQDAGVQPAETLDDERFLRRLMLDLAGRVPTLAEREAFLGDASPDKRAAWVDRLLELPDFALHLRNELDLLLLARLTSDNEWREYLLEGTRANRGWDDLFREIMLPERLREGEKGPAAFLRERVRDLDDLTNDTAVLFFGVNIGCAKCHDHPLVPDWEQQHYYGMASFFQRTYRTKKGLLAERFDGRLKFKTVVGDELEAEFMFLNGTAAYEPPVELSDERRKELDEQVRKAQREDDAEPPRPEFSPRAELVRMALDPSGPDYFSRNMVNRTWARLVGQGFVEPLDQMHSENPPSHPELLETLASDFASSGYDLKRLIRGIVLSETYARDSRLSGRREAPAADLFAVALPRPLTPRQLSASLQVATAMPERMQGLIAGEAWESERDSLENRADSFAKQIEIPGENFQVSVDEALLFTNSERVASDYLRDAGDRLVRHLKSLDGDETVATVAMQAVLSRTPTAEEQARISEYLATRSVRRLEAIQQIVWALIASPEFRFNH